MLLQKKKLLEHIIVDYFQAPELDRRDHLPTIRTDIAVDALRLAMKWNRNQILFL